MRKPTPRELERDFPAMARGWRNAEPLEVPNEFEIPLANIEGAVPLELRGTFFRNGPGLNVVHGTQLKHPIDGDGLVAAVGFHNGRVTFRSRFVRTKTHVEEERAGRMLYDGQMGSRAPADGKKPGWRDPAHTNVALLGPKLVAMHEYALPHTLDPVTLETVGQDSMGGALELRTMSAHFRYDVDLDTIVTVAFKPGVPMLKRAPFLSFYEFNTRMELQRATRLSLDGVHYAHDFCLTPSWYVVHVSPFIDTTDETLKAIQAGKLTAGETTKYVPGAPSQMCLIERPKPGSSGAGAAAPPPKVIRLDTDPCHIYHFANCREDPATGVVSFEACCLPVGFNMEWQNKAFLSNTADAPGTMHAFVIDPRNGGSLARRPVPGLESTSCEFPTTNPFRNCVRQAGVTTSIFYLMAGQPGVALPFSDVVKYDARTQHVQRWRSDGVVGEPCFVPRLGRASAWHGDEDDGWVIVQCYVPAKDRVHFCVLDAKKIHAGPVCRIELPFFLPFGFHGTFSEQVVPLARPKL